MSDNAQAAINQMEVDALRVEAKRVDQALKERNNPLSPARLAMAGETLEALAKRAPWEKSVSVTFDDARSVDKPWFIRCGGLRTGLIGGGYSFAEAATKIVDPLKGGE